MMNHFLTVVLVFYSLSGSGQVVLEADIYPGPEGSEPTGMIVYNDKLYFSADDGIHGSELWNYDGASAEIVSDIYAGENGSQPRDFIVFQEKLYFSAVSQTQAELWYYDGVNVGMIDIYPGNYGSDPGGFCIYNGELYFRATGDTIHGRELYKFDGSQSEMVADINDLNGANPQASSEPEFLTVYNGKLYFQAANGQGSEMYSYDGQSVNLEFDFNNLNSGGTEPSYLFVYDDLLYFQAHDPNIGRELYAFDGTNVFLVADIFSGGPVSNSNPANFIEFQDELIFTGRIAEGEDVVLSYDGSAVSVLFNNHPGNLVSETHGFVNYANKLYFGSNNGLVGRELWSYDGTIQTLESDIYSGEEGGNPQSIVEFQDKIYFQANDGVTGSELWSFTANNVGINSLKEASFNVHPNPTSSFLNIESPARLVRVSLTDVTGRLLLSLKPDQNRCKIELGQLPMGLYLAEVISADGKRGVRKVVKN